MRWRFPTKGVRLMQTAVLPVVGITEKWPTGMDFRHITPSSSNGALRLLLSLIRQ
jgi:hypothetical protein